MVKQPSKSKVQVNLKQLMYLWKYQTNQYNYTNKQPTVNIRQTDKVHNVQAKSQTQMSQHQPTKHTKISHQRQTSMLK
jgi:hypothetical protein